ncbi:MAG: hypothetical protein ABH874_05400 [Methanobacteriota archaeon]
MEITIEWTEEDVDHIRKHNVEPNEVESIFGFKYYHRKRGNFIDVIGRTSGSRILFVVLEWRGQEYRVAFARDADVSEKNLYKRKAKGRV